MMLKEFQESSQKVLWRNVCNSVGIQVSYGSQTGPPYVVVCGKEKTSQVKQRLEEALDEEEILVLRSRQQMPDGHLIAVREADEGWPRAGDWPIKKQIVREVIGESKPLQVEFHCLSEKPSLVACAAFSTGEGTPIRAQVWIKDSWTKAADTL